jgi:hypothetical protein
MATNGTSYGSDTCVKLIYCTERACFCLGKGGVQSIDRVLVFPSCRPKWDPSHPLTRRRMCPPLGSGKEEMGWGSPNSDERTDAVVLEVYMYFVGGVWRTQEYPEISSMYRISMTVISGLEMKQHLSAALGRVPGFRYNIKISLIY